MGHRVIRLHYSADPAKSPLTPDGKAWVENEANKYLGGMSSLLWRREMEIDFGAGSGELIFPEFYEMEDVLTCDPFDLDPNVYNFFGGFDWGTRNPYSFHVYAESPDHQFFSVWELYGERHPVPEVSKLIRQCPYYNLLQWIAADPSIWTENIPKKDSFASIASMMQDEDEVGDFVVDKLTPAHDRSDVSGINKFKSMWSVTPPRFVIFRNCVNQISEFKNLKYPERKETTNETEKILDKNNHTWDDAKYFLLSHPYAKAMEEKPKYGSIGYINRMTHLAAEMAAQTGRTTQEEFYDLYGQQL